MEKHQSHKNYRKIVWSMSDLLTWRRQGPVLQPATSGRSTSGSLYLLSMVRVAQGSRLKNNKFGVCIGSGHKVRIDIQLQFQSEV